jgi:hypothetical protein
MFVKLVRLGFPWCTAFGLGWPEKSLSHAGALKSLEHTQNSYNGIKQVRISRLGISYMLIFDFPLKNSNYDGLFSPYISCDWFKETKHKQLLTSLLVTVFIHRELKQNQIGTLYMESHR